MSFDVRVDTTIFDGYMRDLSINLRRSLPDTIRMEAAAVIKTAALMHKPAKAADVRKQARRRVMSRIDDGSGQLITINSGKRGGTPNRIWYRDSWGHWHIVGTWSGGNRLPSDGWHLPNGQWSEVKRLWKSELNDAREEITAALRSRGLTIKSWVQILDALNLPLQQVAPISKPIPSYALNAMPRSGKPYKNGTVSETEAPGYFLLETTNTSPLAIKLDGARKIEAAIRNREGAYRNALKHGVFESASETAKRYPGIEVSPTN